MAEKKMLKKEKIITEEGEEKTVKKRPDQQQEVKKGTVTFTKGIPARVEEIIGRTGTRGEAIQVRCRVLEGYDQNKVLRRNVKGPIQVGDILMLRETEFEAKQLSSGGRGSGA